LRINTRQYQAACLAGLFCFLLSACGFQLRGYSDTSTPLQELTLSCSSTDAWVLCHHLKQTLLLHGIDLTDDAPVLLAISPMIQKTRVLSLQANASAAELGLNSEISYQLITRHDDEVRHQQSVHITNSYRHESSALLAKDRERDELQNQLSQQLAEEIVRQISVLDTAAWTKELNTDNATASQEAR
jgi:LPS-assembly lipoprotein